MYSYNIHYYSRLVCDPDIILLDQTVYYYNFAMYSYNIQCYSRLVCELDIILFWSNLCTILLALSCTVTAYNISMYVNHILFYWIKPFTITILLALSCTVTAYTV